MQKTANISKRDITQHISEVSKK